ncbi:MAG TPA: redox-regulated ATPase YchF [Candidatus Micrarchaeia archaeon]|nr:redox-regulated ATPase YchF [Candidatus Micrarchaeia archaeon]
MSLAVGIVGLPNSGKSTLFNALTGGRALVGDYPFTTIDPNTGVVPVPDGRLQRLAALFRPPRVIPATVTFTDIAGLVRGASRNEGLGNQFLGHVRTTDAIALVVRAFTGAVAHVEGSVDPVRDMDILELELALADLATVDRRLERVEERARRPSEVTAAQVAGLRRIRDALDDGRPARAVALAPEEGSGLQALQLLTAKPALYVANVDEAVLGADPGQGPAAAVAGRAAQAGAGFVTVSAKLEAELAELEVAEAGEYLRSLGVAEAGLGRLSRAAYAALGLLTFFTAGEKEVRAWTLPRGGTAVEAAGAIHTDFARGFIRAEVCDAEDLLTSGGYAGVRERGRRRLEGRDYEVRDGDVVHFLFNV